MVTQDLIGALQWVTLGFSTTLQLRINGYSKVLNRRSFPYLIPTQKNQHPDMHVHLSLIGGPEAIYGRRK
eukprot:4348063-Amphidinium_carterae.1